MRDIMKKILLLLLIFSLNGLAQNPFAKNKADELELQSFKRSIGNSIFVDKKTVKAGDSFSVVLELQMVEGWYVYWKTSGGIGMPMEFNFTPPPGIKLKQVHYPYPKYKYDETIRSATYYNDGNPTYIFDFEVEADAQPGNLDIEMTVNWQACKVQCIQPFGDLPVRKIPVTIGANSEENPEIKSLKEAAIKKTPKPAPSGWGLHAFYTKKSYQGQYDDAAKEQAATVVTIQAPEDLNPVKMNFFSMNAEMGIQANHYSISALNSKIVQKTIEYDPEAKQIEEISGVVTIKDGENTIAYLLSAKLENEEFKAPATTESEDKPYRTLDGAVAQKENKGLFFNILLAFLGGFILNLMPCVFPVLSIKVMGFVKHAEEGKHKAIQHALVFTLGALISFWILAGAMLVLKSASSEAVNWGFQLQNPTVVLILIIVLFAMSLNLFGVFEIGVGLTSAGQSVQGKSGFAGSFFSGVLATVVATPCMAPMLGAALTYALTQPAATSMIIFTFIALGMCSPYVFLAAFPKFLNMIPKPGAWMETFKQAMGFLMLLAVVWLMETLQSQLAHTPYFFNILWGFVGISVGLWIYGKYTPMYLEKKTRIKGFIASAIIVGLGVWYSYGKLSEKPVITWNEYDIQVIEKKLAEGTPVFIDFTATWCASCQVNKKIAIYPNADLFEKKGVYAVKADFTNKDPKLGAILEKFDSSGVPLNLLYDGENPKPVKLPEVFTKSILEEQLNKLK